MTKTEINRQNALMYLGFVVLFVAFVLLIGFAHQRYAEGSKEASQASNLNNLQLRAATTMRVAARERAILLWHMTLHDDPFERDDLYQKFLEFGADYLRSRIELRNSLSSEQEKALFEKLDQETSNRAPVMREIATLLMDFSDEESYVSYLDQVLTDQVIVSQILDDFIHLQHEQNEHNLNLLNDISIGVLSEISWMMLVLIICGAIFAQIVVDKANTQAHELAKLNLELKDQARIDSLTGLPNRLFLQEHLQITLSQAERHNKQGAVLFIDLDGFKQINDSFGHESGDLFLRAVARDMHAMLRTCDVVARLGGDEFIVVLYEVNNQSDVITVVEKLLKKLSSPHFILDNRLQASASIGACCFPFGASETEDLIRCADDAMYKAKAKGKNTYHLATPSRGNLSVVPT